jgi:uncharacterized membrane protein
MRILFVVLSLFLFFGTSTVSAQQVIQEEKLEAVVTQIKEEKQIEQEGKKQLYQKLELLITKGSQKGEKIIIENGNLPQANVIEYEVGDTLMVTASKDYENKPVYYLTDFIRRDVLYWLFGIFVAVTVIIGGLRGATSLFGMAFSFLIIFTFILPQINNGHNPVLITILGSLAIIPVTFSLSHGFNKKTLTAMIGTVIALIITGLLATVFVNAAHLLGFASEEAMFLASMKPEQINIQGLLLAGIIIGALGVLDDVTISQAAVVHQLKKAAPHLTFVELYNKAMHVGRDHIASVVNTLVLVYTGAAMPLLLLFINNPMPFAEVINYEILAEEIMRTLVASIGLILAVPLTTLLAAYLIGKKKS